HVSASHSNYQYQGIDGALPCGLTQIANGCDLAIADSDIPRIPWRASAVDDVTVCDDEIERRRWFFCEGQAARQKKDKSNHCEEKIRTTLHWFGLSFYLLCGSNGKCPFPPAQTQSNQSPNSQCKPFVSAEMAGNCRHNFHQYHSQANRHSNCRNQPFTRSWAHAVIRCAGCQPSCRRRHRSNFRNRHQDGIAKKHTCRRRNADANHRNRWSLISWVHSRELALH